MLKIRDAKPLFALSTLLIPWELFRLGQGLGWGIHFPLVRYVPVGGRNFFTVLELFNLSREYGVGNELSIVAWMIAGTITGLAALYVVLARAINGTTRRTEDRVVGVAFGLAGALFIVSRFPLYDLLLVGGRSDLFWYSIPLGAVYTIFVGAVFYWNRFQLGA
jgi:hypothetical protein